ncbi:MAG: 4-(cytidine 5'-diphospho)-2-C-methyl-D-erythritol kinase [Bacteroidales bacterium]|nr:4-(cytidine 5'-diphospho)-2-C-methyl-D-erythritol kinase [Bacteroidales bacterium]MDE6146714.1 4-(cytidine 5'-diphospho)-2-C-methyl-D-erythritol kinase [Bacteroidales bacterium]
MITHPNVKLNFGLNVLRKREDGFHDLETLFVPYFGICDTLEIISGDDFSRTSALLAAKYGNLSDDEAAPSLVQAISDDGKLMVTIAKEDGVGWNPLNDLCAKAYFLLDKEYGLPPAKIFLEKTSPVGAGLGGGSSDAAFALKMLDSLFGLGLADEKLAEYAALLGSDCAFFIYNRPMIGEGRGEILTPYCISGIGLGEESGQSGELPVLYEVKVIVPEGISVSTADAYRGITPQMPEIPLRDVLSRPVSEWNGLLANDFEKTVFAKHPELEAIKKSLYDSGAVYASMSGSGSALFAVYPV